MAKLISKLEITSISLRACKTSLGWIVTTIYKSTRLSFMSVTMELSMFEHRFLNNSKGGPRIGEDEQTFSFHEGH